MNTADSKIEAIVVEFAELEPRERLEMLLEYSENLPPLPERYRAAREAGEQRVHECQTPVYLYVDVDAGLVEVHGDVAPEAPTVKGFLAILAAAFEHAPVAEVLSVEPTILRRLGLIEALGMTRMRGLTAILQRIQAEVRRQAGI